MNTLIYLAEVTPDVEVGGYTAQFIDMPEAITEADTLDELLVMSQQVVNLCVRQRLKFNNQIPIPTSIESVRMKNDSIMIPIVVNMSLIEDELNNSSVKKTLTIPYWLNKECEKRKVNFSQILQVALKEYINVD